MHKVCLTNYKTKKICDKSSDCPRLTTWKQRQPAGRQCCLPQVCQQSLLTGQSKALSTSSAAFHLSPKCLAFKFCFPLAPSPPTQLSHFHFSNTYIFKREWVQGATAGNAFIPYGNVALQRFQYSFLLISLEEAADDGDDGPCLDTCPIWETRSEFSSYYSRAQPWPLQASGKPASRWTLSV